jgi:hypothetical protein
LKAKNLWSFYILVVGLTDYPPYPSPPSCITPGPHRITTEEVATWTAQQPLFNRAKCYSYPEENRAMLRQLETFLSALSPSIKEVEWMGSVDPLWTAEEGVLDVDAVAEFEGFTYVADANGI